MTMLEQGREHVAHLVKQKAPFAIGDKDISWREYAHRGGSTLIIKINGIDKECGDFENLRLQTFYQSDTQRFLERAVDRILKAIDSGV